MTYPVAPGDENGSLPVQYSAPTHFPIASQVTASPSEFSSSTHQFRKRRGAVAAILVLSLLAITALGLGTYFWFAADRWQANAIAWEEQARSHGSEMADLNVQLTTAQAQIEQIQQHLESAQLRITELANERAQLGDQQIVDQSRIDFQQRLSTAAGQVASSLDLCISRQDELIEALRNPGRYTAESVAHFSEQVIRFCSEARQANSNLQAEINR